MYVDYQQKSVPGDEAALRAAMQEAMGFNHSDLNMNKAGKLSVRQMVCLVFTSLTPFLGFVAAATGLATLGLGLWMGAFPSPTA